MPRIVPNTLSLAVDTKRYSIEPSQNDQLTEIRQILATKMCSPKELSLAGTIKIVIREPFQVVVQVNKIHILNKAFSTVYIRNI